MWVPTLTSWTVKACQRCLCVISSITPFFVCLLFSLHRQPKLRFDFTWCFLFFFSFVLIPVVWILQHAIVFVSFFLSDFGISFYPRRKSCGSIQAWARSKQPELPVWAVWWCNDNCLIHYYAHVQALHFVFAGHRETHRLKFLMALIGPRTLQILNNYRRKKRIGKEQKPAVHRTWDGQKAQKKKE